MGRAKVENLEAISPRLKNLRYLTLARPAANLRAGSRHLRAEAQIPRETVDRGTAWIAIGWRWRHGHGPAPLCPTRYTWIRARRQPDRIVPNWLIRPRQGPARIRLVRFLLREIDSALL